MEHTDLATGVFAKVVGLKLNGPDDCSSPDPLPAVSKVELVGPRESIGLGKRKVSVIGDRALGS